MAKFTKKLPDGSVGIFDDRMSEDDINSLIEEKYPDYRVLPDGKYGRFDSSQSDEERDNLIRQQFKNYKRNSISASKDEGLLQAITNSLTSNWGSEGYGTAMAVIETMTGDAPDFNSAYDKARKEFDEQAKIYHKNNPVVGLGMDVAGGVITLPLVALKGATYLKYLSQIWNKLPNSVKATLASALTGGLYGLGTDDNRIEGAKEGLYWGGLGGFSFNRLGAVGQKVKHTFFKKNPSVENYRKIEQDLYKDLQKITTKDIQAGDFQAIKTLAENKLKNFNFDPKTHPETQNELDKIKNLIANGDEFTLSKLQEYRTNLWKIRNSSRAEKNELYEVIKSINEVVENKTNLNDVSKALWTNSSKATQALRRMETVDKAIQAGKKAKGNVEEKYKEVVNNILNDAKVNKWKWEDYQIEAMEKFVNTKHTPFWKKQLSKLSYDATSFSQFLHWWTWSLNPKLIALTGAGTLAKISQRKQLEESINIIKRTIDPNNFQPLKQKPYYGGSMAAGTGAEILGSDESAQGFKDWVYTP